MMSIYSKWASKEYPLVIRIITTLCAGTIFVYLIPLSIFKGGPSIDHCLGLHPFSAGIWNVLLGGICILTGFLFGIWSNITEINIGRGTPIPVMATQKLLVEGPFKLCRNPMSLGAILAYVGIGILIGSPSALILSGLFSLILILYLKLLEEKELLERFGDSYREYLKSTPFIIPKWH
jgi:protein-S-isoprenylcysteine O-methyltransferase Ste14